MTPSQCAECGHLHYLGPQDGYSDCPIEGCDCQGQTWAQQLLTRDDLAAALDHDDHLGWGYATREHLDASKRAEVDGYVVRVANELEIDADDLFHWTNGKYGRWLVDHGDKITIDTVREYLNPAAVAASRP